MEAIDLLKMISGITEKHRDKDELKTVLDSSEMSSIMKLLHIEDTSIITNLMKQQNNFNTNLFTSVHKAFVAYLGKKILYMSADLFDAMQYAFTDISALEEFIGNTSCIINSVLTLILLDYENNIMRITNEELEAHGERIFDVPLDTKFIAVENMTPSEVELYTRIMYTNFSILSVLPSNPNSLKPGVGINIPEILLSSILSDIFMFIYSVERVKEILID